MTTWVLLRGLTREAGHWGGFGATLQAALGDGHRVLALDLPGNGTLNHLRSPASVPALREACRAELRRLGHGGPCVLVAMSLGAMVALDWAAACPGELAGCVLINTSLRGLDPPWQRLQPRNYLTLAWLMAPGRSPLEREQAILAMTSRRQAAAGDVAAAWAAIARLRPVSRGNALRQLVAAARCRVPPQPPATAALLLASAGDQLVSPECSRRLAAAWGWPLRLHPDAGHDLPLDDPAWVLAQIVSWQAGASGGAPDGIGGPQ